MNNQIDVITEEDVDISELEDILNTKKLVVHNDEVNTFDGVINALIEVCKHTREQAEQCTFLVHFKGKCAVKEGSYEKLKPLKEGITDRGINATIE